MDQQNLYLQRINHTIDYIQQHIADDLPLNVLARVASFSPFHFHRIFKTVVGETVNDFVNRLRIERAAALLKGSPKMSLSQAASVCGFSSLSSFSRAFKKQYGISARQWDRRSALKNSKNGQILNGFPRYTVESLSEMAETDEFEVRIRELPAQPLAYIRVLNSYASDGVARAYERLIAWFCGRDGNLGRTQLYGMSQDDPEVTPLPQCRYDIGLTVPADWTGEGEVSVRMLPACYIATIHCVGDIWRVDRAWQYLYNYWLPRSRFQPDNLPAMEIYRRQPLELGWETYDLECAVPVIVL